MGSKCHKLNALIALTGNRHVAKESCDPQSMESNRTGVQQETRDSRCYKVRVSKRLPMIQHRWRCSVIRTLLHHSRAPNKTSVHMSSPRTQHAKSQISKMTWHQANGGFPGISESKESAFNAADLGLKSGSERSPGEGNGNPLQYSCLQNPMDRGAWGATVRGVAKSWTRLSD